MKEALKKIIKRRSEESGSSRITNDTVAEHREKVLAGGRRFKYPIQYAKHKLVINAVIISVVSLVALIFIGWWQLYLAQNTTDFMYRVTRVIPVPVASVDGYNVAYSDYLMKYRSAAHYLETKEQLNLSNSEGAVQAGIIKQQAMNDAVSDAYAVKLANELGISVSNADLDAFLKLQRRSSDGEVSEQTYNSVILDYYNWAPDEYRHATRNKLLKQRVSYAIDEDAQKLSGQVAGKLKASSDLSKIAKSLKAIGGSKAFYGSSGWVPKTNQDGGLADVAIKLKEGEVSSAVEATTGDGYYFVKLVGTQDAKVKYDYISVNLSKFDRGLQALIDNEKVQYYIKLEDQEVQNV